MARHHKTGELGEKMAAAFLTDAGYTILHQNWRHSHWEIDIIASKTNVLHFIEVKTRRTTTFGYPEDDVSRKKISYLINASEEYLFQNPGWNRIQFDILSILLLSGQDPEFFLIEDIYL